MKVWVYTSRRGEVHIFSGDESGWDRARTLQDSDNGMTVDDFIDDGLHDSIEGSYEVGSFRIEDGGSVRLEEVK